MLVRWQRWAFRLATRVALLQFEGGLRRAAALNTRTLRDVIVRNAISDFGRRHDFAAVLRSPDPAATFQASVPLTGYRDYDHDLARIARGESHVLTTDPVHMLAGSAGTTDQPKRLPRTRRAQRHHLRLVVLAEQAVIDRAIPGANQPHRGINLMSLYAPPAPDDSVVPVMAGPNAGMARLARVIPLLWCAPVPVYAIADPVAAQYVHALFALQYAEARFIETPFAPQIVAWFALIERRQHDLVRDLCHGTLTHDLNLTPAERAAVESYLRPDPRRGTAVEQALALGLQGIVPRLWPHLRYLRTVTSGTFALSVPRLRWLTGPHLPIHSGCHSSSEGIIGINLHVNGRTEYVLAVGTAYFEFIPLANIDAEQPKTVDLTALEIGADYELVLTSVAGLYRYRLGDVIRITGRVGEAPTFEYRYRRGTLLNLVGEKTSEYHTEQALTAAIERWRGRSGSIRDYTVAGRVHAGRAHYTFYVELTDERAPTFPPDEVVAWLDAALGDCNPYYRSSGRLAQRLDPPELKFVGPGTFDSLLALQQARAVPATASQVKVPRLVTGADQLALLEAGVARSSLDNAATQSSTTAAS